MFHFSEAIVLGTTQLTLQTAAFLRDKGLPVHVCEFSASKLEGRCALHQIPYHSFDREAMTQFLLGRAALSSKNILIVSAANIYLFPSALIQLPNVFIINYHNALLPLHRGMNAEAWCIFQEDKLGGITWHRVNEGIDKGEIFAQESFPLGTQDTSLSLLRKQSQTAFDAFQSIAPQLLEGRLSGREQSAGGSYHSIREIPGNGILDLQWPGHQVSAFLRALDYGAMRTLGTPKLTLDGQTFQWSRYQILPDPQTPDNFSIQGSQADLWKDGLHFIFKGFSPLQNQDDGESM